MFYDDCSFFVSRGLNVLGTGGHGGPPLQRGTEIRIVAAFVERTRRTVATPWPPVR